MNLSFDKDHKTISYNYTIWEFHNLAMEYYEDSIFSHKDLCATPRELFEIASQFPDENKDYREDIYRVVLHYGTKCYYHLDETQKEAVWECFLALPPDCKVNCRARENFVNFHLDLAIKNENTIGMYSGETWEKFCEDFREREIASVNKTTIAKLDVYWADTLAADFLEELKGGSMYSRIIREERESFKVMSASILKALGMAKSENDVKCGN